MKDKRIPRKEKKFRRKLEPKILALIEKELKPYQTRFWGVDVLVSPAFVQDDRGDGLQLIWLSPIDSRPQFYVLRIDSHWDINADDFDLEYMLTMIAEDYGDADRYVCIDCENNIYVMEGDENNPDAKRYAFNDLSFPMLRWEGGSWGLIKNFRTGKVRCY
ncbi:hypothetical protein [Parabacteroides pacaensis]|uniref:hypothetical protein n=1 Tax=Parabacteroides pacaensis TaxID=2086575 RepID=UPI000D0F0818|nr:hypothetical protein [Parabacteroides pacaensis]